MALFEDLYGRKCRSPIGWFEIGEVKLIGPDFMHQAMDKVNIIKEQLKTTQRCEKSYSDMHRRDLEFKEDDWVVLKVSPMKVVVDPSLIFPVDTIGFNEEFTYEEVLVAVLE
uniref:Reverse transcriptase domain-containing protein n=1 Tax=Nicotiana tabacum TaxID=4097 RepID=A0A1S3Y7S6_TOBAC